MGYAEHITAGRMNEVLSYDPLTGDFRWKISTSKKFKAGQIAGSAKSVRNSITRYIYVRVDGKDITAARAAWVLQNGSWPSGRLGFINGDPQDVRFENIYEMKSLNEEYSSRADYLRKHRKKFGREWKDTDLTRRFGISLSKYSEMVVERDNKCDICGQPETQMRGGKVKSLAVDHDHKTGAIRGLLCCDCNQALGKLGDSVDRLKSAIAYLDRSVLHYS